MGELRKPTKVFISHSSQDVKFVKPFVDLLEDIGLNEETMFCSSITGFNIPLEYEGNIFSYLKNQFQEFNLRVIFILSDNCYKSAVCLNEMGASWVLQNKYTSILLPGFEFQDIRGVIDHMKISIKLDSEPSELKSRLNELRRIIMAEIGIQSTSFYV